MAGWRVPSRCPPGRLHAGGPLSQDRHGVEFAAEARDLDQRVPAGLEAGAASLSTRNGRAVLPLPREKADALLAVKLAVGSSVAMAAALRAEAAPRLLIDPAAALKLVAMVIARFRSPDRGCGRCPGLCWFRAGASALLM